MRRVDQRTWWLTSVAGPFGPVGYPFIVRNGVTRRANVLVLGDDDGQGQTWQSAMFGNGDFGTVTFIPRYWDYDGITPALSSYDVVFWFQSWSYSTAAPFDAALDAWVQAGGGLVRTMWALWQRSVGPLTLALLPVTQTVAARAAFGVGYDYRDAPNTFNVQSAHPTMRTFSGTQAISPDPYLLAEVALQTQNGGVVTATWDGLSTPFVAAGSAGSGRCAYVNTFFGAAVPVASSMATVLRNAAWWCAGGAFA